METHEEGLMNKPRVLVIFTEEGMEPTVIDADTEEEGIAMEKLLEKIQPCLDVINAIVKKGNPGPKG